MLFSKDLTFFFIKKSFNFFSQSFSKFNNISFFIAILSGALMSRQGVFNTQVTKASGIWAASAFVQLTAFMVCLGAWFGMERKSFLRVFSVEPKYMLLGGVIGALITYTVIKSMDSLGPAKAVLLIVVSQLAVAYGMELFGIFGVEKQREIKYSLKK